MTSVAAMAWPSSRSKQDDDLREQHFSDSQRRFVKRAGFRKPALFFDSARNRPPHAEESLLSERLNSSRNLFRLSLIWRLARIYLPLRDGICVTSPAFVGQS